MRRSIVKAIGLAAATSLWAVSADAVHVEDFPTPLERFDPGKHTLFKLLYHPPSTLNFEDKRDRAAAFEFYAERDFQPLWYVDGRRTERGEAVVRTLHTAWKHALNPASYPVGAATISVDDRRMVAKSDVLLTLSALRYARHAKAGRIIPSSVSKDIGFKPNLPDPIAVLKDLDTASSPEFALQRLHPEHLQYWAIQAAYETEMRRPDRPVVKITARGEPLKRGARDPRVMVLRARLGVPLIPNPDLFTKDVHDAVMAFQRQNGLKVDGVVGRATVNAMNSDNRRDRLATYAANMERWRWMPRDLGRKHILVNIPHYTVRVEKDGRVEYEGRVVVGKPQHKTPMFSDEMEHVVVNPYWYVPRSIATNEILPQLATNPGAIRGYEVLNASGRPIDPSRVRWTDFTSSTLPFTFRQPPGARNALGQVKFLFPNKHSVYLHDTPARSLFQRTDRAFSHGCIRLHEPWTFAEAILAEESDWSVPRAKRLIGGQEEWIDLTTHIPVHITYFTAWAQNDGRISVRRDIYGHDQRMMARLR